MGLANYKVYKSWINEADFEILVLKIPEAELEDKLAYLASQKGVIAKSFYEDFIIATCIANINQLLSHVKQQVNIGSDLDKIRGDIVTEVLRINKALEPDNLVVNRNHVVKLKGKDGIVDGERSIIDNKSWNMSYYDPISDEDTVLLPEDMNDETTGDSCDINSLEFKIHKSWWKRITQYVNIKGFSKDDIGSILKYGCFHNKSSFQTLIVSICVVNSDELFTMLDDMGLSSRVAPPILMGEVYELCVAVNPFLTYEKAKELMDNLEEDPGPEEFSDGKTGQQSMVGQAKKQKKKVKKKFKSVPKKELLGLAKAMKISLIGQDEAVDAIADTIQRASVGLKDPVKPIGSFLFAGSTGCGKSLSAKVLADTLIKEKDNLITIDCSEFSSDHEYAKLIGSPNGYIGHDQGGALTNAVSENPFSIIVFDEVEKASTKVHELLLQIMEEGRLTDGKSQSVSFKDTVVIMTSNIGVKETDAVKKTIGFGDVADLTDAKKDKAIDKAIKSKFKPEFLNRIDSIVNFKTLTNPDYKRIIDIELNKLNEHLKENGTDYKDGKIKFSRNVKTFIFKNGINKEYGARPLKRCIEKKIATPLARKLLESDVSGAFTAKVGATKGKVEFDIVPDKLPADQRILAETFRL